MVGVVVKKLKIIDNPLGNIYHGIKKSENEFVEFGEAYFTSVNKNAIKGWKKHNLMTLNLIVPIGKIKIVIYSAEEEKYIEYTLSEKNYCRLTVSPGLWLAFKGYDEINIMMNIASMEHNPVESDNVDISEIKYDWG